MAVSVPTSHLNEFKTDNALSLAVTSSAFTPQSNSILLINSGGLMTTGDPGANTTIADSLGTLTWVPINRFSLTDGVAYFNFYAQFYALIGTAASMTVTISNAALCADAEIDIQAFSCTGHDTSTPIGGIVTTTTLGSTGAGTIGSLSAAPTVDDLTIASRRLEPSGSTDSGATAASGWVELSETSGSASGYGNLEVEYRQSSTSDVIAWGEINVGGVTVRTNLAAAFVIKAAAAGGAVNRIRFPSQQSAMGVGGMLGGNRLNYASH